MALSIAVLLYCTIFYKADNFFWIISIIGIILGSITIILLPITRGYAYANLGDQAYHLGAINFILETGYIHTDNIYPITHLLLCQLINITAEKQFFHLSGIIFYILFIIGTYVLCKAIAPNESTKLAVLSSTVLFCYYYHEVFPMGYAFILYPFIIYLHYKYRKSPSAELAALCLIVVILEVFFHVIASFLLLILLIFMNLIETMFDIKSIDIFDLYYYLKNNLRERFLLIPAINLFVLLTWIMNNYGVWHKSIYNVAAWFHTEILVEPMTSAAAEAFSKLGFSYFDILELFIKSFGAISIYLVFSLIGIIALMQKSLPLTKAKFRYICGYVLFFLLCVAFWLLDYIRPITSLSSGRIVWVVITLFPLLVGVGFSQTIYKSKNIITIFVLAILCTSIFLPIFSTHPSPYVYRTNLAVSHKEVYGAKWLLTHGDANTKIIGAGTSGTYRYQQAFIRIEGGPRTSPWDASVPDHFNYTINDSLGQSLIEDRYMILRSNYLITIYRQLYPTVGRFFLNDFLKLLNDSTVDKLYENDEVEAFYVRSANV